MNVVLVAIDTLRADHLSCYGYTRTTSPNLDELANESVRFTECLSECAHTVPSFTSMVTGLSPISHGIVGTNWRLLNENSDVLDDNVPVLAETLAKNGYCTAAVDNLMSIMPSHPKWFVRGYRYYMNPQPLRGDKLRADQVNEMAIPWLKEHCKDRFFLFLHYWDPHQPYSPPAPFNQRFAGNEGLKVKTLPSGEKFVAGVGRLADLNETKIQRVNMHDGEISYVDDRLGMILSTLKEQGIYDDSLIVVTADHGDSMAEHNCNFEHREVYDSTINVPLIYKLPEHQNRRHGKTVDALVQHADLMPTILDLVGVNDPPKMEGHSLKPLIFAEVEEIRQEVFSTGSWIYHAGKWKSAEMCIRTKKWKFYQRADINKALPCPKPIFGFFGRHNVGDSRGPIEIFLSLPRKELYDLASDPEEQINMIEKKGDIAQELEKRLEKWTSSGLFVC